MISQRFKILKRAVFLRVASECVVLVLSALQFFHLARAPL